MTFTWYDNAGRPYGLTPRQVAALVKKHSLTKRRIYGAMAVEATSWNKLMQDLGKQTVK